MYYHKFADLYAYGTRETGEIERRSEAQEVENQYHGGRVTTALHCHMSRKARRLNARIRRLNARKLRSVCGLQTGGVELKQNCPF